MTRDVDFLDTNVVVYAFTDDPRSQIAEALLEGGCASSVQVLNEFANVARRKLKMGWPDVEDALATLRILLVPLAPLDLATHLKAIDLCAKHGWSVYDGLIVASALSLGCRRLWSEDLQHGFTVDGAMTIENPFLSVRW